MPRIVKFVENDDFLPDSRVHFKHRYDKKVVSCKCTDFSIEITFKNNTEEISISSSLKEERQVIFVTKKDSPKCNQT